MVMVTGLSVENAFRQRAPQVSRMETFVDAAFAFSLMLPVIVHKRRRVQLAEESHA